MLERYFNHSTTRFDDAQTKINAAPFFTLTSPAQMSTEQTTSSTEQQQQAETVQELRALLSSARARIDDLEKQNNKWKHTASALVRTKQVHKP